MKEISPGLNLLGSISVPAQIASDFSKLLVAVEALIENNCTLADVIQEVNTCRKHLDLIGADVDPGFGVDVEDSARLLELRQTIDSYFGWKSSKDELRGDYVARVKEVADAIWNAKGAFLEDSSDAVGMARALMQAVRPSVPAETVLGPGSSRSPHDDPTSPNHRPPSGAPDTTDTLLARIAVLERKRNAQRKELRRFNREDRIRREAVAFAPSAEDRTATLEDLFSKTTAERIEQVLALAMMPPLKKP